MQILQAFMPHPFADAGILLLVLIVATLIADYFHNGVGLTELNYLLRRDKSALLFSAILGYALCDLFVNLVRLALFFFVPHA